MNHHLHRFELVADGDAAPVLGRDGMTTSFTRVKTPGVCVIGFESQRIANEMTAEAFEGYLAEEGLAHVIDRRAALGEGSVPGREVYRRCAKALLCAGGAAAEGRHDQRLGLPVELVAETNPYALPADGQFVVRLVAADAALADTEIVLVNAAHPERLRRARTDAEGRARVHLDEPGAWMITAIHMVRVEDDDVSAEWESFWASLTFRVPETALSRPADPAGTSAPEDARARR